VVVLAIDFLSSPILVLTLWSNLISTIWHFFPIFSTFGLPLEKCWDYFLDPPNYINTPPSHPPILAYSFLHLPFHLHISNDLVSSPPTYLPTHLPTKWHSYTYLPTHLPLWSYQHPTHYTSVKKCWWNQMWVLQSMWHHQMRRFDEIIAFHHVNDCVVFSFLYLLATEVPTKHHIAITTCLVISMIDPPFA